MPVVIAVNKAEGVPGEIAEAEFHTLGFGTPVGISAVHGHGIDALLRAALASFPVDAETDPNAETEQGPKVAVIGRPNVGKSTLINRLLGENRLITSPEPGTTRDSIHVPVERDDQKFVLVDTAGLRRRARVSEAVEKYSVVQTLQAIEEAGAVIAVLDARENVTDQDLHVVGLAGDSVLEQSDSGREGAYHKRVPFRTDTSANPSDTRACGGDAAECSG